MKKYHERLHRLQHRMQETHLDAFLCDDATNLFYLTGLQLSAGKLLVQTDGAQLIVDGRYLEYARQHCPFPSLLMETSMLPEILQHLQPEVKTFGFDKDKTTYQGFFDLQTTLSKQGCTAELKPIESPLKALRRIKDADEIELLRNAAKLGAEGFDFLTNFIQPNITEKEAATALEIFWRQKGASRAAFDPIIAFGPNSAYPHYRAQNTPLVSPSQALIDIGCTLNHYHSDMTRMLYYGEIHPKLQEIHKIVQEALETTLEQCRPGITAGALDTIARNIISSYGYGDNFTHSLGHGVGLEIHESPTLRNKGPDKDLPLEPGMIITIEPGIYLPGLGGVRLEDTILVTASGYDNLTNRPRNNNCVVFS